MVVLPSTRTKLMPASELIAKTATEIVALLKAGEVTTFDLLDAL